MRILYNCSKHRHIIPDSDTSFELSCFEFFRRDYATTDKFVTTQGIVKRTGRGGLKNHSFRPPISNAILSKPLNWHWIFFARKWLNSAMTWFGHLEFFVKKNDLIRPWLNSAISRIFFHNDLTRQWLNSTFGLFSKVLKNDLTRQWLNSTFDLFSKVLKNELTRHLDFFV